jgi:hypothetical protein
MVRLWWRCWRELAPIVLDDLSVEQRLEDLPRPGAPSRLSADQVRQIEQVACEAPERAGRPISQWTGCEIADELDFSVNTRIYTPKSNYQVDTLPYMFNTCQPTGTVNVQMGSYDSRSPTMRNVPGSAVQTT